MDVDQSSWPDPWPPKPDMSLAALRAWGQVLDVEIRAVWRGWTIMRESFVVNDDAHDERLFDSVDGNQLWDGILLVITHSAALSRMLFPVVPTDRPMERWQSRQMARHRRGEQLRLWLHVADDSPLNTKGRDLRNEIEHWDEKIEKYFLADSADKFVIDMSIGPQPDPCLADSAVIRTYDTVQNVVGVGRERVDLSLLLREVERLEDNFRKVRSDLWSDRFRAQLRTPPR